MADTDLIKEPRITKEEAKELARLAEAVYEGFEVLDRMFPEWAPFKHALCHPCATEGCGKPIRYGEFCDQHRPVEAPLNINLIEDYLRDIYRDGIQAQLNAHTPLLQYYTGYNYNRARVNWDKEQK